MLVIKLHGIGNRYLIYVHIIHDMIDYILYDTLETPNLKQPLVLYAMSAQSFETIKVV